VQRHDRAAVTLTGDRFSAFPAQTLLALNPEYR
jgi:hypothetical protein